MWPEILTATAAAVLGYFLGSLKFFKEHQLRVYGEVLPVVLKYTFDAETLSDETEFNKALSKVWLYGSKKVAIQLDKAVTCRVNNQYDEFKREMQLAIIEMRNDILPSWHVVDRSLRPEDVRHFYFRS